MFQPCPSRSRRTNIVRVRTGCQACRHRKRKCDEQKPSCGRCVRQKIPCEATVAKFQFRDITDSVRARAEELKPKTKKSFTQSTVSSRTEDPETSAIAKSAETSAVPIFGPSPAAAKNSPFAPSSLQPPEDTGAIINSTSALPATRARKRANTSSTSDLSQIWDAPHDFLSLSVKLSLSEDAESPCPTYSQLATDSKWSAKQQVHTQTIQGNDWPFSSPGYFPRYMRPGYPEISWSGYSPNGEQAGSWVIGCITSMSSDPFSEYMSEPSDRMSTYCISGATVSDTPKLPSQEKPNWKHKLDMLYLEDLYLSHFEESMSSIVPLEMCRFQPRRTPSGMLKSALLALAAANMSYLHELTAFPSGQDSASPATPETSSSPGRVPRRLPNLSHLEQSASHYKAAIRHLSDKINDEGEDIDLETRETLLATSLILALFERQSGTWRGFQKHFNGAIILANQGAEALRDSRSARSLLKMLDHVRSLHRMSMESFRLLDAERATLHVGSGFSLPPYLIIRSRYPQTPDVVEIITQIMLLTRRLVTESIIDSLPSNDSGNGDKNPSKEFISWLQGDMGRQYSRRDAAELSLINLHGDELLELLEKYASDLVEWHRTLDIADLPVESYTEETVQTMFRSHPRTSGNYSELRELDNLTPLVFRTHEAAMRYMYYTLGQLFCSRAELLLYHDSPQPRSASLSSAYGFDSAYQTKRQPISPWAILTLRIALNIDPKNCLQQNIFMLGVCDSMLSLCLAQPSEELLNFVQDNIFRRFEVADVQQEDAMSSIHITRRLLGLLVSEARAGRMVLGTIPTFTEDSEKTELYNKEVSFSAGILGRLENGEPFRDIVIVP